MIELGTRRELFWDDYLVNTEKSTAKLCLHRLEKKELVMDFNMPWEGDGCSYFQIVKNGDSYRMYYGAGQIDKAGDITYMKICFVESKDGKTWVRPKLGLHEFEGSRDNNIILVREAPLEFDNFFVFIDTNPNCPPEEKWKGIGMIENHAKPFPAERELWCYLSPDGIHFTKSYIVTDGSVKNGGIFDSLNTAYWDEKDEKYKMYVRGIHSKEEIRDVRYMESKDFKNWSEPKLLQFGEGAEDYPLYTNVISRYYRAPHILTGFPSRYVQRRSWNKNFDQLCGREGVEKRREIMKDLYRAGLTVTDCVFMTSRDGINWHRFDEAFITAGIERKTNWVYGDCYPAFGMIQTTSDKEFAPDEISMYMHEGRRWGGSTRLYRYTMRQDGFASYRADYPQCTLYTKPFTFSGNKLSINFSTSARGYMFITLCDRFGKPIEGFESCELFGDSLDRTVYFGESCDVSALAGEEITMRFVMSDADIYSFVFED